MSLACQHGRFRIKYSLLDGRTGATRWSTEQAARNALGETNVPAGTYIVQKIVERNRRCYWHPIETVVKP